MYEIWIAPSSKIISKRSGIHKRWCVCGGEIKPLGPRNIFLSHSQTTVSFKIQWYYNYILFCSCRYTVGQTIYPVGSCSLSELCCSCKVHPFSSEWFSNNSLFSPHYPNSNIYKLQIPIPSLQNPKVSEWMHHTWC